jgi:hypothetical protein
LLVSDLAGNLAGKAAEQLRILHDSVSRISSRITRVRIDLSDDLAGATVRFHARVNGIRRSTSQPLTVFDGEVRWALTRTGSRWIITSSSGA